MIRAAAKNFLRVAFVTDPSDYSVVIEEIKKNNGFLTLKTRFNFARKAFEHTVAYDRMIADFFGTGSFEDVDKYEMTS